MRKDNREKELLKKTTIITIGKIATQMVNFFLLPLYTYILTTEDYGYFDLTNSYVQVLLPVVTLLVEQGAFRFLIDADNENKKKEVISSSWWTVVGLLLLYICISVCVNKSVRIQYKYWLIVMLVSASLSNWMLQVVRGLKNTVLYSVGSFVLASATIVINVIGLVVLKCGMTVMFFASTVGNMICFIVLFFCMKIYKYITIKHFNRYYTKQILKYSIPLIPNQLLFWILNFSDRLVVKHYLGVEINGILAVSHKFPAIYSTFFSIFLLAWQEIVSEHYYDSDRDEFLSSIYSKVLKIFCSLCILETACIPFVFNLMVSAKFDEAYYTIPIYMFAALLNTVVGLLGGIYIANKQTKKIASASFFAGIINIVVHIVLIKYMGLYAAAISTFISYLCIVVYRMIEIKHCINIKYNVYFYLSFSLCFLMCSVIYYYGNIFTKLLSGIMSIFYCILLNKDMLLLIKNRKK